VTPERRIAAAFAMDDAAWARHANPWSGWTRLTVLPALVLAGWSRAWIGWWALLPLALALAWAWANPHLFPPPRRRDAWMTRGVLGERLWLERDRVPVPAHHRRVPHLVSGVAALGGACTAWGVVALEPWPTLLGMAVAYLAKLWFVDRMVWLHRDMEGEGRR
jgi:hypothetical protein